MIMFASFSLEITNFVSFKSRYPFISSNTKTLVCANRLGNKTSTTLSAKKIAPKTKNTNPINNIITLLNSFLFNENRIKAFMTAQTNHLVLKMIFLYFLAHALLSLLLMLEHIIFHSQKYNELSFHHV